MPIDNLLRVRHVLDAAEKAVSFLMNKTKADLENDEQLALSLVRLLEILGEAANMTSEDFRAQHPHIPWRKMIDLRNRLIHGYFDIDLNIGTRSRTTSHLSSMILEKSFRAMAVRPKKQLNQLEIFS